MWKNFRPGVSWYHRLPGPSYRQIITDHENHVQSNPFNKKRQHSMISVLAKIRSRHHFLSKFSIENRNTVFKMWTSRFESTERRTLLSSLHCDKLWPPALIQIAYSSTLDYFKMSVSVKEDPSSEKIHQDSTSEDSDIESSLVVLGVLHKKDLHHFGFSRHAYYIKQYLSKSKLEEQ